VPTGRGTTRLTDRTSFASCRHVGATVSLTAGSWLHVDTWLESVAEDLSTDHLDCRCSVQALPRSLHGRSLPGGSRCATGAVCPSTSPSWPARPGRPARGSAVRPASRRAIIGTDASPRRHRLLAHASRRSLGTPGVTTGQRGRMCRRDVAPKASAPTLPAQSRCSRLVTTRLTPASPGLVGNRQEGRSATPPSASARVRSLTGTRRSRPLSGAVEHVVQFEHGPEAVRRPPA